MEDDINDDLLNDSAALNFLGTMKRYPFNGLCKYLIDKFFIIGYDYQSLNKILIKNELDFLPNSSNNEEGELFEKKINNLIPQEFKISEPPSLLNEISNNYSKEVLDMDLMIDMIFPNKPNFYYTEEDINSKNNKITELDEGLEKKAKTLNKEESSNLSNILNNLNNEKSKINEDIKNIPDSNIKHNKNDDKNNEEELIPSSYNVIFSSNPQSEGNSKKSINGFAHVFYKKFNEKRLNNNISYSFYVPIVFCIISEFPYYNSYYKLTRQIMLLFKKKIIEVPIEFTIQNIVNFTLSPINDDVVLNIFPLSFLKLWHSTSGDINFIEEVDEEKEKDNDKKEPEPIIEEDKKKTNHEKNKINQNIINDKKKEVRKSKNIKSENLQTLYKSLKLKNSNNSKLLNSLRGSCKDKKNEFKGKPDFLKQYNFGSTQPSFHLNPKFMNKEEESTIKFEPIKFKLLPGYPLIQYNLAKVLLDTFSSYEVILIFIYTFLEKDILFFSENIELLSLTMNCYQNLNFPLNDEKYYFINAAVSYDNFIAGNSSFVGSAFTTMIGINSAYQSSYMNSKSNKLKEHLVVDLDSGVVNQIKDQNNRESSNKNKALFDYIKKTCKSKETKEEKEQTILSRELKALNDELTNYKEQILNEDEFKYYSLIEYNHNIHKINLGIQESFYRFINNICIYLYQNLKISIEFSKNYTDKTELEFDKTYSFIEYTKEEKYFLDELGDTMKFESFIYGFIQSYNPIDLYKIPLTFTEEFVSILSRKSNMQLKNIKFFSLFDSLYQKKQNGRIDIDFVPFISKYFVQYKQIFERDIQDFYTEKKNKNKFNLSDFLGKKKVFNYNYTWYELDNNLILKYLDLLKTLDEEEYKNIFHFQLLNLENNNIRDILVSDIENKVEKYAIDSEFLSKSDICCGNIILLFTLTLKLFTSNLDIQSFLSILFSDFTIFRKYYTIVMNMTYKLMEECIKNKDYSHAQNFLFCYFPCINSINNMRLVPNENLMNTIKKFNSIDINALSEKALKSKEEGTYNTPLSKYNKSKIKKEINEKNLYVCYNFTRDGVISEKDIVYEINNNDVDFKKKFKNNIIPKIKFKKGKNIIESEIYPQIKILEMLTKEYNLFNKDLDISKIDSKILIYASMNIFVFIRNNKDAICKSEILEILNAIFYIYFERYLKEAKVSKEKKSEKEEEEEEKEEEKKEEKENENNNG